jgi:hypothetical protein
MNQNVCRKRTVVENRRPQEIALWIVRHLNAATIEQRTLCVCVCVLCRRQHIRQFREKEKPMTESKVNATKSVNIGFYVAPSCNALAMSRSARALACGVIIGPMSVVYFVCFGDSNISQVFVAFTFSTPAETRSFFARSTNSGILFHVQTVHSSFFCFQVP